MKYEAHITVDVKTTEIGRFMDRCELLGGKAILIELIQRGTTEIPKHPLQIMLGRKIELLDDCEAQEWLTSLQKRVTDAKFIISRAKLEAEISDGCGLYWEAHWKIHSKTDAFYQAVPSLPPSLLASRSIQDRGRFWMTARKYDATYQSAFGYFQQQKDNLFSAASKKSGIVVSTEMHWERVIADTNPSLDENWAYLKP